MSLLGFSNYAFAIVIKIKKIKRAFDIIRIFLIIFLKIFDFSLVEQERLDVFLKNVFDIPFWYICPQYIQYYF